MCKLFNQGQRMVAVEGRLQLRSYEDRDGIKRTVAKKLPPVLLSLMDVKMPPMAEIEQCLR